MQLITFDDFLRILGEDNFPKQIGILTKGYHILDNPSEEQILHLFERCIYNKVDIREWLKYNLNYSKESVLRRYELGIYITYQMIDKLDPFNFADFSEFGINRLSHPILVEYLISTYDLSEDYYD